MRMLVNVALILIVGVSLGMTIRAFRPANGPGPDDVVYTNEDPLLEGDDFSGIENPEPAKPPEGEAWLSRFELTERSGETIRSEDLVGEPYIVSFFFSTCPSICVQKRQN